MSTSYKKLIKSLEKKMKDCQDDSLLKIFNKFKKRGGDGVFILFLLLKATDCSKSEMERIIPLLPETRKTILSYSKVADKLLNSIKIDIIDL